jgi:hypothetical protein
VWSDSRPGHLNSEREFLVALLGGCMGCQNRFGSCGEGKIYTCVSSLIRFFDRVWSNIVTTLSELIYFISAVKLFKEIHKIRGTIFSSKLLSVFLLWIYVSFQGLRKLFAKLEVLIQTGSLRWYDGYRMPSYFSELMANCLKAGRRYFPIAIHPLRLILFAWTF